MLQQMIRAACTPGTLAVLSASTFLELSDELGGLEGALLFLVDVATANKTPIALNLPTTADPDGPSTTLCVPPKGWSQERVSGWVAARHQELEAIFGQVERIYHARAVRSSSRPIRR